MTSSVSRSFPAKFDGECLICGFEIAAGEMVCFYDDDLVHDSCAEEERLKYDLAEETKEWTPKWRR